MKTCNWARMFINLTVIERVELLPSNLINIFRNYIPNNKVKFEYGEAPWINRNIESALCKRSRITKRYYANVVKCKVIMTCYLVILKYTQRLFSAPKMSSFSG